MLSNTELEEECKNYGIPYNKDEMLLTQLMKTTILKEKTVKQPVV